MHRPPTVSSVDTSWCATICCERRVHNACLSGLTGWGACPMCMDDFCSECHRSCNPELCLPRPRMQPPSEDTKYHICQTTPLLGHPCGHSTCPRHSDVTECPSCTRLPQLTQAPQQPPYPPNLPPDDTPPIADLELSPADASPAHSEGDYEIYNDGRGPFQYASYLSACSCGGIRNTFECTACGLKRCLLLRSTCI